MNEEPHTDATTNGRQLAYHSESRDLLAFFDKHFPSLRLLRRREAGSEKELHCRLKGDVSGFTFASKTRCMDLSHFTDPYYQREPELKKMVADLKQMMETLGWRRTV